jgi:IS5 family transposase
LHLVVEKQGRSLWIETTSANGNEKEEALVLLDALQIVQCKTNAVLTPCEADKGYDSDSTKQQLLYRGYLQIIGYRKNRKGKVETKKIYEFFRVKKFRWVVERCLAWLKRKCRRLMMRWERTSEAWNLLSNFLSFSSGLRFY